MPFVESCPICGGDRIKPYAMDAWAPPALHFAQARCAGCGLLISQPQASEAEMDVYYGRSYFEEQWPDSNAIWRRNTEAYTRYELPLMRELWADWPPPAGGVAAEVGCGYGVMLGVLRDAGYQTRGCDLSARAVEVYRSRGGWDRLRARVRGGIPPVRSSADHTFVFLASHLRALLSEAGCDDVRTRSFSFRPTRESLHWRLFKGLLRAIDRRIGHREFLMAVGRRAQGR